MGDNNSTVEGIQYSGGSCLISTCLVISNDEKISTFFVLRYEISFGSFSKIQVDFPGGGVMTLHDYGYLPPKFLKSYPVSE